MAKYRFGDIVLVQFPFTDQTAAKKRPGVVAVQNWREARLLMPSSIKPVFATLDRTLIIRVLGTLSKHDSAALRAALPELLG